MTLKRRHVGMAVTFFFTQAKTKKRQMDPIASPVFKVKKRANHNELERKRRNQQKNVMNDLRDAIPILQSEKPSTVLTLTKAREYIQMLERKSHEQELELVDLRKRLKVTPGTRPAPAATTTTATVVNDQNQRKTDLLRRENDDLRNKISSLERKLQSPVDSPSEEATSPKYADFIDNFEAVDPSLLSAAEKVMNMTQSPITN